MGNMKHVKVFVVSAMVVLSAGFQTACALEAGQSAPDFTLADMDGKRVSLSEFNGKVIIINFFANWCPPCRMEIPDFITLQRMYGPKNFTVIGISLVNAQDTKKFADEMGINYPLLIDNDAVSEMYGPIRSIPTTYVIGKDSKIARVYVGMRTKDVFEKDIKALSR
jgi:cytochrome c biogenesis protein CcmG/thiol:disulfide interchange protein DsbE